MHVFPPGPQPKSAFPCHSIPAFLIILLCLALLAGCGGGSSSSSTITVSISPASTTLSAGQTASFVATVSNTKNTAVTWKVNGVDGGNSTYGTITASGVYYAPGTVSSTVTETITAVSTANTSIIGTASVTLTPSTSSTSTFVSVSPSYVVLAAGAQQTFAAQVSSTTASVTWKIACKAADVTACGTISSSGVYTAPLSPPPAGTVMITATPTDGSTNTGSSSILVQYSNATLTGRYAFSFAGQNGSTAAMTAGSIQLDGAGNILGGVLDSAGTQTAITGGTYHIGTDGRGAITVQAGGTSKIWQIVALDHSRMLAAESDTANLTMSGSLDLQDPTQFDIGVIAGTYTIALNGPAGALSGTSLAQVGTIVTNGAGAISQGLQDINTSAGAQPALAVTGSFTAPDSNGRGQLILNSSFGSQNFTYYLVNSTYLKLLDESAASPSSGQAVKQVAGPFTGATIKGSFATAILGANAAGAASVGAQIKLASTGTATATLDSNVNGNVETNIAMTGNFTVTDPTSGRTQLTIAGNGKTYNLVLYPAANQDLYILDSGDIVAAGQAYSQQGFVITIASLAGSFGTSLSGVSFSGGNAFEAASGQLVVNGGGAVTGTLDVAAGGALTAGANYVASYFVDSTGFVTVTFTSSAPAFSSGTLTLYPIDAQQFLSMEIDSNRVMTGFSAVHN